jgi:hypothetical protein
LRELNNIILPKSDFDFLTLKEEITRLKTNELIPQNKNQKTELEKLITNIKSQAGTSFAGTVDLLLQTHQQILAQQKENDPFAQGQLETFKKILLSQAKLTTEEIQSLLTKQKES